LIQFLIESIIYLYYSTVLSNLFLLHIYTSYTHRWQAFTICYSNYIYSMIKKQKIWNTKRANIFQRVGIFNGNKPTCKYVINNIFFDKNILKISRYWWPIKVLVIRKYLIIIITKVLVVRNFFFKYGRYTGIYRNYYITILQ